jgi:hypothetical protein
MTNTIPPRAGLVGQGSLTVTATTNQFASVILSGQGLITANGYAGRAASADLVGELTGGQTPPQGRAYDPSVIGLANSSSSKLVGELIGSEAEHPINLALNWDAGYGWKYGPQEVVIGGGGGSGGATFIHTQSTTSTTWTVPHNLGFRPDVDITSTGGIAVEAEVSHSSNNLLTITFDIPFSGYARCT